MSTATTVPPPPPPPLEKWVSAGLLSIIRAAPANPSIRGAIRNELRIVPPTTLFVSPTTQSIETYLLDNYNQTATGIEAAAQAERAAREQLARDEQNAAALRRSLTRNNDGSMTIPTMSGSGEEVGHAQIFKCRWRATISSTVVPAEVVAQGPTAIYKFIRDLLESQGATEADPGTAETDDYRYYELVRDSLTLTECSITEGQLAAALR